MNTKILFNGLVIFSMVFFWVLQAAAYDPAANENLIVFDSEGQVTGTYHLDDLTVLVSPVGPYDYKVQSELYLNGPTGAPSVNTTTVTVPSDGQFVVPNLLQASFPSPPSGVPQVSLFSFDDAVFDSATPTRPGISFSPSSGTYTQTIAVSISATPSGSANVVYRIDGGSWKKPGVSNIQLHVYKDAVIEMLADDGSEQSDPKTAEFVIQRASKVNPEMVDSDRDGIPDSWEVANSEHGFDPLSSDRDKDTDGDGISDFNEILRGFDPLNPCHPKICYADIAGGLSGSDPLTEEDLALLATVGQLPLSVDSDQDGWSDWDEENLRGTLPDNPSSVPVARRLNEVERKLSGTFWNAASVGVADLNYNVSSFGSETLVSGITGISGQYGQVRIPVGEPCLIRGAGLSSPLVPEDPMKNFVSKRYIPVTPDILPGDVPGEWNSAIEWQELYVAYMAANLVEDVSAFDVNVSDTYPLAFLERELEILEGLVDIEGSPRYLLLGSSANIPALTTLINMEQLLTLRNHTMNDHLSDIEALLASIQANCSGALDLSFLTDSQAAYIGWSSADPLTTEKSVAAFFAQDQPAYLAGLLLENSYEEILALGHVLCSILNPVADLDGDGVDNQDEVPVKDNPDGRSGIILSDTDSDGINDLADNCPKHSNAAQEDYDGDGIGDVCDSDADGDQLGNGFEMAFGSNPYNEDTDGDGKTDYEEWLAYTNPGISVLITQLTSPSKMYFQTIGGTIPLGVTAMDVTLNGNVMGPVSFDSASTAWSCPISGVNLGNNALAIFAQGATPELVGFASAVILRIDPEILRVPSVYATIQDAIDAAEDGDQVLVSPGTYPENINFRGKAISVSKTVEPDIAVIEGTGTGPVVTFNSGEDRNSVLNGFIVTNGDTGQGGGIFCGENTSPVITNNTIHSNNAYIAGGGIFAAAGARPTIVSNTLDGNSAPHGGGIYGTAGSVIMVENTISTNSPKDAYEVFVEAGASYLGDYNNLWNNFGHYISGASAGVNTILEPTYYLAGDGYRLADISPCIDAGNDGNTFLPLWDQDGKPRILDGNMDTAARTDMGAYEYGDPCEGDISGDQDSDVDGFEIFGFIQEWGSACDNPDPCDMDLNHDGEVNAADLIIFAEDFGREMCP